MLELGRGVELDQVWPARRVAHLVKGRVRVGVGVRGVGVRVRVRVRARVRVRL